MNSIGTVGVANLKKQIKSIEGIKKVTKAMSLVSTSKFKKVREVLDVNTNYYTTYREIIDEIVPSLSEENIYLRKNASKKRLIIVITSDRGMCGGYNYSVVNKVKELEIKDEEECSFLVIGKKGASLFNRHGFKNLEHDLSISDIPVLDEANSISKYCLDKFLSGEYNSVSIIYTWFKNPIIKEVKERTILPIDVSSNEKVEKADFDIEGNSEEFIDKILLSYCSCLVLNAILNSKASEQSMRMETMNSASQSADELISDLKLKYNRIRQAAITQEISEIVGGTQR